MWNDFVGGITNDEMLRVLDYIDAFVNNIDGGDSYWIDPDGGEHHTDVGYGCDFWHQVSDYFRQKIK